MRHENTGIEALRCWLMFLIVLMHCATFNDTGNPTQARMIHTFCVFGVNAFILISGWFGCRFSVAKIGKLLGLGLFASLTLSMLSLSVGWGVNFAYSLGWFGNSYVALLCVSPILNAAIESLRQRSESSLRMAWAGYSAVMFVSWLPIDCIGVNLHIPGWMGHSFNQMCFMYVTGRVLRTCDWVYGCRVRTVAAVAVVMMMLNYGWAVATGLTRGMPIWQSILVGNRGNNNPIIIILAISVFLLFLRIRIPHKIGQCCAFLGPSMFSVYLLHEAANHNLSMRLYNNFCWFGPPSGLLSRVGVILLCALLVYASCCLLDLSRRSILFFCLKKDTKKETI